MSYGTQFGSVPLSFDAHIGWPVVGSSDVNDYLREATSEEFSTKDIRTWHASVICTALLLDARPPSTDVEKRGSVVQAIAAASARLGNTRAVCKKCYVHPAIVAWFEDGTLAERAKAGTKKRRSLDRYETATLNALASDKPRVR